MDASATTWSGKPRRCGAVALILTLCGVAGCDRGDSEDDPPLGIYASILTISGPKDGTVHYASAPRAPSILVWGYSDETRGWSDNPITEPPRLTVTWGNETTGQSGSARAWNWYHYNSFWQRYFIDYTRFECNVPVAVGTNRISVRGVVTAGFSTAASSTHFLNVVAPPVGSVNVGWSPLGWGSASGNEDDPFNTLHHDSRAQFVVLSSELAAAGMAAGDAIRHLHLHCESNDDSTSWTGELSNFRIRIQHTSASICTAFVSEGWTLVYGPRPTWPTSDYWMVFPFDHSFTWNGADNLLIEISRDNSAFGPWGRMYVQSGLPSRMFAGWSDSASAWPFDTGLTVRVLDAIPELRLDWVDPPANDNFEAAIPLEGSTVYATGSNIGATGEAGEPDHAGLSGPAGSIWWTWTAPDSGPVAINTFGSDFDTTLAVYTGSSVANLTLVAGNDDSGRRHSQVCFTAISGITYRIAVDGYGSEEGSIALRISSLAGTGNDDFASAVALSGIPIDTTGTNLGATGQMDERDHAVASLPLASVWWTWTASSSDSVTINTFGSDFDTTLAIYTGSEVADLTLVAENDDESAANHQSRVTFTATAGTMYRIAVDGRSSAQGAISLSIRRSAPENDRFADARQIVGFAATVTGSNIGAKGEANEPNHAGYSAPLASVWWTWTAPESGSVAIDATSGSTFTTTVAVYTGPDLSGLTWVASVAGSRVLRFQAVAGTTYRIAVDGSDSEEGLMVLDIKLTGGEIIWSVNLPTVPAIAEAVAADSSGIYVACTMLESSFGWLIRKHAHSDGATLWTRTFTPDGLVFNDVPRGIAVDGSGVYIAGAAGGAWRIQKRSLTDGALLWNQSSDPSSSLYDEATAIALDSSGVYVAGYDEMPGTSNREWRIEKRSLADGSLLWLQTSNPSSGNDVAYGVAVDSSGVYVVGSDSAVSGGDGQWRIEKRDGSDGSLLWTQTENPASGWDAVEAVGIAADGLYVAGTAASQWRTQKRSLPTGALLWTASGDSGTPRSVAVGPSGVYVVGSHGGVWPAQSSWKFEKHAATDGAIRWAQIGSGGGIANGVTLGDSAVYIVGSYTEPSGSYRTRIEKRTE